jgi:hypothetical protein
MFIPREFPNWLTTEEREGYRDTIHSLREDWRHISKYPIAKPETIHLIDPSLIASAENQHFLGDSLYIVDKLSDINWKIQDTLYFNFNSLYNKLLATVEEVFGCPAVYLPGYARPGFHIFNGEQTAKPFQWHTDITITQPHFMPAIEPNNMYSILCPIEMPAGAVAALEYKNTEDWTQMDSLPSEYLEYNYNSLYMWKGTTIHRMKAFDLNSTDSRITLQGHVALYKNQALIHW